MPDQGIRRLDTRRACRPVFALLATMVLGACVSGPETTPHALDHEQARSWALKPLAAQVSAETGRSVRKPATAIPPPPGLDAATLASLLELPDDPSARQSLPEVLHTYRDESLPYEVGSAPADQEPPADRLPAVRHYIAGRQRLLADDPAGAVREFEAALALDPSAGEAWRELGEAHLAAGRQQEAIVAMERAWNLGVGGARVLEVLGRAAADRGEHEQALAYLSEALERARHEGDPALPLVVEYLLARSLLARGHVAAAREALAGVVMRPMPTGASTRWGVESAALLRRSGDLWRQIGDLDLRLGHFDRAAEAYARALAAPGMEGDDVASRLAYAALRAGRPATAAHAILAEVFARDGNASAREVALLAYLSRHGSTGPAVIEALARYRRAARNLSGTLEAGLTRVQAALVPTAPARRLLIPMLNRRPWDTETARLLADLTPNPAQAVRDALTVLETSPDSAPALAEGLLSSAHDIPALMEALERRRDLPAAGLLLTYLHLERGLPTNALEAAVRTPETHPANAANRTTNARWTAAVAVARASAGVAAGRVDLAEHALATLDALIRRDAAARHVADAATVHVLALLQRDAEALETLSSQLEVPVTASPADRLPLLLMGTRLALTAGQPERAERYVREALEIDGDDERALGQAADLYAPGGPKPDAVRFAQAVRRLRDVHPDGATVRIARAREWLRRQQFEQALEEAREAARRWPGRPALEVFTAALLQRSQQGHDDALENGLRLLDALARRRGFDPALLAARTHLLIALQRRDQAEQYLRDALHAGAGANASRLLEALLRHQGRQDEAWALAWQRLQRRTLLPIEALELAELHAQQGQWQRAVEGLTTHLHPGATLNQDQRARLGTLAHAGAEALLSGPDRDHASAAFDLLELAFRHGVPFTPQLLMARVLALARSGRGDLHQLEAVADQAVRQAPALGAFPYLQISAALVRDGRADQARAFLARLATRPQQPPREVVIAWLRLVAQSGTAAEGRMLVDALEQTGRGTLVLDLVPEQRDAPQRTPRSELAYVLGNLYAALGRRAESQAMYETALEADPDHAWAANNFGYMLVEEGRDVDRAERLLLRALERLPREGAILDSLGWLRYRQGVLHDRPDPATGQVVRGALGLLHEAAGTEYGQSNAVILDHLGDALWLAGRAQEAMAAWERAAAAARVRLEETLAEHAGDVSEWNALELSEYRSILESSTRKRSAAAAGERVRVAAWFHEPDPQPAPPPS